MTIEQEIPGGGLAVPTTNNTNNQISEVVAITDVDIDLCSAFATELGFPPSITPYNNNKSINNDARVETVTESSSPDKKKKKGKNSKKKKKK